MAERMGKQTARLARPPRVESFAACVGKKEGHGPLSELFDAVHEDDTLGQENWERAESMLFADAVKHCIEKQHLQPADVRFLLGGDLLNQLAASCFAGRDLGIPFLGLFGACSTMAESLAVGAMILEGGCADRLVCAASSHFCTAERQFRFPLELGTQRPPSAQWTVTGAGAVMLHEQDMAAGAYPIVTHATVGKPVDFGVTDANNMGAAMAPAAAATIRQHMLDTSRDARDYDFIVTGDLGMVGSELLKELLKKEGMELPQRKHIDCGLQIFSPEQDAHAGGSGCGCSASVLCAKLLPEMIAGRIHRMLFVATGALMSTTTGNEGESIPGIAHAVAFERMEA